MSVDKFGRFAQPVNDTNLRRSILKVLGISLETDKTVNFHFKQIKNIGSPIENSDAATKEFVIASIARLEKKLEAQITEIQVALRDTIENDVDLIQGLIEDGVKSAYKKNMQGILDYLNSIEEYLFKYVVTKTVSQEDDVKILKLKYPKIKI